MDAAQIEAALAAMQQQMQQQQAAYNQQMIDMQSHHSQQMMAAAAAAAVAAATAAATAAAAAAAAPQPPQPLPPPPRGPAVRIAAPAEFDGRIGTLDAWQSLMRQQFDFFEYGPNADRERIRLCAVMLRGHALEWWQTRVNEPASWECNRRVAGLESRTGFGRDRTGFGRDRTGFGRDRTGFGRPRPDWPRSAATVSAFRPRKCCARAVAGKTVERDS
jgi:hypothetical protein